MKSVGSDKSSCDFEFGRPPTIAFVRRQILKARKSLIYNLRQIYVRRTPLASKLRLMPKFTLRFFTTVSIVMAASLCQPHIFAQCGVYTRRASTQKFSYPNVYLDRAAD